MEVNSAEVECVCCKIKGNYLIDNPAYWRQMSIVGGGDDDQEDKGGRIRKEYFRKQKSIPESIGEFHHAGQRYAR